MGTLIFLIFMTTLGVVFHYRDTKKHNKIMVEFMLENHFSYGFVIRKKIEHLKDTYPLTYDIVNSFLDVVNKQTLHDMSERAKPIEDEKHVMLQKEIDLIIKEGTREDKEVLEWYLITCILIVSYQKRQVLSELEDEIMAIKDNKIAKKREDLCII